MIVISFVFITLVINLIKANSNQIIQLSQVNLTEEYDYKNYLLYSFDSEYKLQLIPSSKQFNIIDSKLYVTARLDRESLIENSQCQSNCVLELKIASYDDQNNIVKIYNLPVLIIDINDNRPEFKHQVYYLNISENLSSKTIVSLDTPLDLDSNENSIQNCQIRTQTSLFSLSFSTETKSLFLVIESPLDRENTSMYILNISCTDFKSETNTKLVINVLDANDNVPYFTSQDYNVTIAENVLGELVQVRAYDLDDPATPNAWLIYSLESSESLKSTFFINETTGVLSLLAKLDYEKVKKYTLRVKVQDQGPNPVPIFTNVFVNVLDMNDNAPTAHLSFADKYVQKENRSNNTIWILEEQNYPLPVSLGFLTLSDLDSAEVNGFNLSAELVSIKYFDTQSKQVEEEQNFSFRLTPIIQEYNNVYYSLQLVKQVDREQKEYFDIQIKLSDNKGVFALKNQQVQTNIVNVRVVVMDLNDNSPQFKKDKFNFSVKENLMALNFGLVEAYDLDLDAELEFKILDSDDEVNPNFLFFINPNNGSLSLRGGLDREKKEFYNFTVRVSDASFSVDVPVEIQVLDENDNEPFYKETSRVVEIEENLKLNSIITNVKPIDLDKESRTEYYIEPVEINNYFLIDSKSGNLMTAQKIDAEKFTNFTFKILVKDSEFQSFSSSLNMTILIKDINDNLGELFIKTPLFKSDITNCTTQTISELSVQDIDREAKNRQNSLKIGQIRRLSWQLINEIIKNYNNKTSELTNLIQLLDKIPSSRGQKINLRNFFSLSQDGLRLELTNSCRLNPGFYNLSVQISDQESSKIYSIKVFVFNGTFFSDHVFDQLSRLVDQWWSINSAFLSKRVRDNQNENEDLDSFIYSNLTSFNSKKLLGLTGLILFSKGSNLLIATALSFILIIVILLITILYKSIVYKRTKSERKLLNLKIDSTDSSSLGSSKIKTMSLKGSNQASSVVQDSFTLITSLEARRQMNEGGGSMSEESYLRTFSSGKTDENLQVNDMGYYGSSDYSDSFQQRNSKKLKNDSFTSSSVLSSPSTHSDASSSSNYRPAVTNLYPYKPVEQKQNDVKIYFERFERIYNSDSLNTNNNNSNPNRITTYSYV